MFRFTILCSVLLTGLLPVLAQNEYLPIQEGKHWGYINTSGEVVIKPIYDLAHAFSNGAAKVQKEGKNFLINPEGKRISPMDIEDFRHVSNRILFTQNQKEGMCNYEGKVILEPIYSSILPTQIAGLFKVGIGNQFGLVDTLGADIVPCSFSYIQYISGVFWCLNSDDKTYSFYVPNSALYLPGDYTDIRYTNGRAFVQLNKRWYIDGNQDSLLSEGWQDVLHINKQYFVGINKGDTTLYAHNSLKPIANNFGFVESFDSNRLILNDEGIRNIVVGEHYIDSSFGFVSLQSGGSYFVLKNQLANYLDSNLNPMFEWKYRGIEPVDNNYARVRGDLGIGLLSLKSRREIISPRFSSLKIYDDRVKAYSKERSLWLFSITEEAATDSIEFKNYATVKAYSLDMSQGAVQKNNIAENAVVGRWFIEDQKWGYLSKSGAVLIKPIFSAYNPVGNTRFAIVQTQQFHSRTGALISTRYGIVDQVEGILLVYPNCTFIDQTMMADSSFSVVRIRNQYGAFALIHKSTGKTKRIQSPFIDDYVNGLARIYVGGKLSYTESPSNPHISVAYVFTNKYGYTLGTGYIRMQRYVRSKYKSAELRVYTVGGQWNYVDKHGNLLLSNHKNPLHQLTYATPFDPNNAVVYRQDTCALINSAGDFLSGFEFNKIVKVTDSVNSYYKVTRSSSSYNYYNKFGQNIGNVFEYGNDFNDGAAWIRRDGVFYILREDGTVVKTERNGIPYRNTFHDGYSPLRVDRLWTVVDTNGTFMFNPKMGKIIWCSDGYSAYRTSEVNKKGKRTRGYAVLDASGSRVSDQLYKSIQPFQNGYSFVRFQNSKTGFIDTTGAVVTKKRFSKTWGFDQNGLCVVRKGGEGVLSTSGKMIVPTKFSKVYIGDSAILAKVGKHVVVYNHYGKRLASYRKVERLGGFDNGLAMIRRKNKVGYIGTDGRWSIQPTYSKGSDFSNGVALVRNKNGQHVINSEEHILSSFGYKERIAISEGYLVRSNSCGFQYYSAYGMLISPKCYEKAMPFKNGFALVMDNGMWGVINTNGDEILSCEYASIRINEQGEISANKYQTYGLIDQKGQEVVSPTFDDITYLPDYNLYTLRYGFVPSYLSEKGEWLWQRSRLTSR